MNLKTKLAILISIIFISIGSMFWYVSKTISDKVNEDWALKYIKKQIVFDKYRLLIPMLKEMQLVLEMSQEPALIAMAKDENNSKDYQNGIKVLEKYKELFTDKSYFAGFKNSGNYYYNDRQNSFGGTQYRYKLSKDVSNDSWFFTAMKSGDDMLINVDKDIVLDVTKVWLNCVLKDGDKILGVVGTGFDFDTFVEESVLNKQNGVKNYFIDKYMSIQLAQEKNLIDYASFANPNGEHKTIESLFDNSKDIAKIKSAMQEVRESKDDNFIKTLWVTINGHKQLVGIAYLPEIGWYSVTLVNDSELIIFDYKYIFIILIIILLIALLLLNQTVNQMFIKPINALKSQMHKIQNGQYDVELRRIGSAEIAELSNQFNKMVQYVKNTEYGLEEKIKQRTASIAQSEQKFRALFDSTQDAVMLLDEHGFFECNQATLNIFKCPDFKTFYTLHPSDLSPLVQPNGMSSAEMSNQYIKQALESGSVHFEWVHKRYNSNESFHAEVTLNTVLIDNNKVLQAMVRDISQRKQDEAAIHQLAFYDPLTHLPNRRLLNERVLHAIEMSKRDEEKYALLFFDLDNFKPLNDKYGHDIGDLLLIEVAKRLKECVRESDTVARFGGDEFVILLEKLGSNKQTAIAHVDFVAQKILQAVANEYSLTKNGTTVAHYCSVSIGIDIFDSSCTSVDTILKNADLAMYQAKEMGRNQVVFFEQ